jgi:hypothetical protein
MTLACSVEVVGKKAKENETTRKTKTQASG